MADETRTSGEPADSPRRRRAPPPTIDLAATETPAAGAGAPAADPPSAESPSVEPGPSEPADSQPSSDRPPDPPSPPASAPESERRGAFARVWPQVAAGALGAVLALVAAAGLWALRGADTRGGASELNARLTRAEARLGELARPATDTKSDPRSDSRSDPRSDSKASDDLAQRLGRIEAALANPRSSQPDPALADLNRRTDDALAASREARERAETAANALADVARQLALLNAERARTPAVERADLDALRTRLAGLESTTKTLGDQLAKTARAAGAGDVRQALIAIALDAAAERGAPYGRELAALDPQAADPAALAALKPFAESGIPGAGALARELAALMPEARRAADASEPEGGARAGFLDRLQANAERLVRIRPIEEVAGDDPAAVISRIQFKAVHNDLPGALAEFGKLPVPVRAPAQAWIAKAQARAGALAASRAFAANALVALAQPSR
jgi:hypothetical protein